MTPGWGNERFTTNFGVGGGIIYGRILHGLLIATNQKTELLPGIATKWEISKDGKTWAFTIRDGGKFHDGKEMTTTGFEPSIRVWSVPAFEEMRTLAGHTQSVNALALSTDQLMLASASTDRTVRLWDYASGACLRVLRGHTNTVAGVKLSPDGRWVATASYDATVRLWPLAGEDEPKVLRGHPKNVTSVAFSKDAQMLASGGLGDEVFLWSVVSGQKAGALAGHRTAVGSLAFTPDGARLWSLGYPGSVIVWSTGDWQPVLQVDINKDKPYALSLAADGRLVAITLDHGLALHEAERFERVAYEKTPVKGMYGVAFSPDGRLVAATSADGKARVWEVH
jgi:WD40 repeat protein